MKQFLLHIPESMVFELDEIAEELNCSKSQFIRQSIMRNLDICRNVEMPLLREHSRQVHQSLLHNHADRKEDL